MKFTTATASLLFAALAIATPAPISGSLVPETIPEFRHALMGRAAAAVPDLDTRSTTKPKGGSKGSNTTSAAGTVSPSGVLVMGVLGMGVVEVVRLWG